MQYVVNVCIIVIAYEKKKKKIGEQYVCIRAVLENMYKLI